MCLASFKDTSHGLISGEETDERVNQRAHGLVSPTRKEPSPLDLFALWFLVNTLRRVTHP